MKTYRLPLFIEKWIEDELHLQHSMSLTDSLDLAKSIKKMADYYVQFPNAETPWKESWCQQAQIAYYFPLNFLRNWRVFEELYTQNFFNTSYHWIEFGVGLGPSLEAFRYVLENNSTSDKMTLKSILGMEKSEIASQLMSKRWGQTNHINDLSLHWKSSPPIKLPSPSLVVLSYSLTELTEIPEWVWQADAIIIIEPSTREDGRRLQAWRDKSIDKGYCVIAPCTHQQACPLLTYSQKDWCHDRITIKTPAWFEKIESHLPFKNSTLTLSYLALKRQDQNEKRGFIDISTVQECSKSSTFKPSLARVTGDFLNEKGKTRQLVCRGPEREFLTFLKKKYPAPVLYRGDLVQILDPIEKKGDELRVSPDQVVILNHP